MFSIAIFASDATKMECNRKIHAFLSGMVRQNPEAYTFKTREELAKSLKVLEELVDHDNVKLTQELICYKSQAKGVAESMLPALIIKDMKIHKEDIFWGVMPLLDCNDMKKRQEAYEVLEIFENVEVHQKKFSFYEEMLKKYDEKIPLSLIDHMYSESPETALSTMANVYMTKENAAELMHQVRTTPDWKTKPGWFSDKDIVSDPQTMVTLSKRSEWWILLYVAKRMQKNSQSFSEEALTNLKKCQHPLVMQTLSMMTDNNENEANK